MAAREEIWDMIYNIGTKYCRMGCIHTIERCFIFPKYPAKITHRGQKFILALRIRCGSRGHFEVCDSGILRTKVSLDERKVGCNGQG